MPPVGPLLKNDGPACRVCGCTEHNACLMRAIVAEGENAREVKIGCSWVLTRGADCGPLCSACAGTAADMAEAIKRGTAQLAVRSNASIDAAIAIGREAVLRRDARARNEATA